MVFELPGYTYYKPQRPSRPWTKRVYTRIVDENEHLLKHYVFAESIQYIVFGLPG